MKKIQIILVLSCIIFLNHNLKAQNKLLDKVIVSIGNTETITLLEFEKRKEFFLSRITNRELLNQQEIDKEIIEKLLIEKIVSIIGKEKNIIIPDDNNLIRSITDEKLKEEIQKEKLYKQDYISEIKQQFIISRLITSDDKLKNYLSSEPSEEEINKLIDEVYEKNKTNAKTVKVSFITIAINLPQDLSLKEEKEIENIFSQISNLIEQRKYKQALEVAEKRLSKYIIKEATRYSETPISIQTLAKEGFPIELLGALVNIPPKQNLPFPIKVKIKGKDLALGIKILSREEINISKEEFKEMFLLDPNLKQQITLKISEDRIKNWIISTFKSYGYQIKFLDKKYEIKI